MIGYGWENDGFRYSIEYFLQNGYKKSELYGAMWGFADLGYEYNLIHNTEWLLHQRTFIEAVLDYTGAQKVDIIAHSMGVTISRAVLKGGSFLIGNDKPIYLGAPLSNRVNTYIAIAGGNFGIQTCAIQYYYDNFRICNNVNGFFPGTNQTKGLQPSNISDFLKDLNKNKIKEASRTFAMWSYYDYTIPAYAWNRPTSEFPTMDRSVVFNSSEYSHLGVRDLTPHVQYALIKGTYLPEDGKFFYRENNL